MKKFNVSIWSILFCAVAIGVWFWSSPALAVLNIYEPFNYSTGSLQGQTLDGTAGGFNTGTAKGNSWLQAGSANPPSAINVASGTLTGPAELPPAIGNDLTITGVGNGSTPRINWRLANSIRAARSTIHFCWMSTR